MAANAETDHYEVLGVPPTADSDTIRRAFKERASKCHPDRGGSHREMVRLNEAWEILSDPDRRQRFDAARQPRASTAAKARFAEDVAAAQAKAADYPRDWSQFETWLNGFAKDFNGASIAYESWWNASLSPRIVLITPALAGMIFGAVAGSIIGGLLGADPLIAAMVGAVPGGAAGTLAKPVS